VRLSDETLMAYADGELDAAARAQVEAAIAADPNVARRVAEHTALRNTVRAGFDEVLDEPVPERLNSAARGAAPGQVVPFRGKTARHRSLPQWIALAASFVLGALAWRFGAQLYPSGPVTERNGDLVASGVLAQALTSQLAADQTSATAVQIGITFRSRRGSYCRTFQLRDVSATAGLACHEDGEWKLQTLARGPDASRERPQYRQAASSLPPAVLQAVTGSIQGEALDASAEARARERNWQPER
jgi:hypothetical protein